MSGKTQQEDKDNKKKLTPPRTGLHAEGRGHGGGEGVLALHQLDLLHDVLVLHQQGLQGLVAVVTAARLAVGAKRGRIHRHNKSKE